MPQTIKITNEDILAQVKLSGKVTEIIKQIITRKIIENAADAALIKVDNHELQLAADQFRLINQLYNAKDTWSWLEKHNLSLDDFEKIIYHKLLINKLSAHLFANKIEPYYYANQINYACVVMYEVVLNDEDLALELFYTITEGEMSFYDVAHQYIQDTELRRQGGYRGIVHRHQLKPEISAVVFAANPPQLLQPIVTSSGVHLIFVEEIIQPQLDNQLRNQITSNLFNEWLEQQICQVEIILSHD